MNIDEKIKELEEKLEEIKKENEELKKIKKFNFIRRVECGKKYFYISDKGKLGSTVENGHIVDNFHYYSGNYFKTQEEVERYKQNRLTYQQLKDIALRLNKGQEIYWDNGSQDKYYIYFDYIENEFELAFAKSMRSPSGIYCLDENFLNVALEEIGEERLKQLLEWGI